MATEPIQPDYGPSPEDVHAGFVRGGKITFLDFFDALPHFDRPGEDWTPWRALGAAAFGLPMTDREFEFYQRFTGRKTAPTKPFREVDVIVGRRGGKGRFGSAVGSYLGAYRDYRDFLAPGGQEWALLPIIAAQNDEATTLYNYIKGLLLHAVPYLITRCVDGEAAIDLKTLLRIKVMTASFKAVRSFTAVAALLDEVAHLPTGQAANPDHQILMGLRPTMATIPGSMLWKLSAPDYEVGVLWEEYEAHRKALLDGVEPEDILVWKASSEEMHPGSVALAEEVARETKRDPDLAACSYGAEFRGGGKKLLSQKAIELCVVKKRTELAPCSREPRQVGQAQPIRHTYYAFVDVSGGSSDSYTLAIAHWDFVVKKAVLDLVREWPSPFSPREVTKEACDVLKLYGLETVTGDAYAGEWPRERFDENKIGYIVSSLVKHDIYAGLLGGFNSAEVELLDNDRLTGQLANLRRNVTPTGQERIDHPKGEHDDVINAAAGALLEAYQVGKFAQPQEEKPVPKTLREMHQADVDEMVEEYVTGDRSEGDNDWRSRWEP